MATGIRDKVAIIGMGCSQFGERWNDGPEELMVEAFTECLQDAGIEKTDIQAAWFGSCFDEVGVGEERSAGLHVPEAPQHIGHPGGELLRQRHRGVSGSGLCCGFRGI